MLIKPEKILKLVVAFLFIFIIGYIITNKTIEIRCSAPMCSNMVAVPYHQYIKDKFLNLIHFGNYKSFVFCPEHKERITNGKFDDGDPNTNPDLNKK